MDLVFPKGNEQALAAMAQRLGTTHVIFCYPLTDRHIKNREAEVKKLSQKYEFAILVTNQQEIQQARSITRNIVAVGKPGVYEDKRVRYVINFEAGKREDFIHHRNSGLSQVSINKAKQSGKTLLVNANLLLQDEPAVALGRIMQNNRFFRKYKPNVTVVSGCSTPLEMSSEKDRANLLLL